MDRVPLGFVRPPANWSDLTDEQKQAWIAGLMRQIVERAEAELED